jgi:hypothetical protein
MSQGRPYAVVPGERVAADIIPGTLDGLCRAMTRAACLSADGTPRVIRKDGKIIKRFEDGKVVRDGQDAESRSGTLAGLGNR